MDVDCRQSSPEALHCQSRLLQWHPSYFKEDEAAPFKDFQTYDTHTANPAEAMTWFCMAQRSGAGIWLWFASCVVAGKSAWLQTFLAGNLDTKTRWRYVLPKDVTHNLPLLNM